MKSSSLQFVIAVRAEFSRMISYFAKLFTNHPAISARDLSQRVVSSAVPSNLELSSLTGIIWYTLLVYTKSMVSTRLRIDLKISVCLSLEALDSRDSLTTLAMATLFV